MILNLSSSEVIASGLFDEFATVTALPSKRRLNRFGWLFACLQLASATVVVWMPSQGYAATETLVPKLLTDGGGSMQVLETVSAVELRRRSSRHAGQARNVEALIDSLTGLGTGFGVRVSLKTESALSRGLLQPQPCFQIAVDAHHFEVAQVMTEDVPQSYSANHPVRAGTKLRSDEFLGDTFYSHTLNNYLNTMYFGSLDTFMRACDTELGRPPGLPGPDQNLALEAALIDYRKYVIARTLGHENIRPLSYRFTGLGFTCTNFNDEPVSGQLQTDERGVVEMISYMPAGRFGPRTYMLLYDRAFPNCDWFPSTLYRAEKRQGSFDIKMVFSFLDADVSRGTLKKSSSAGFATKATHSFTGVYQWSNGTAYKVEGSTLQERPELARRAAPLPLLRPQ